MIGRSPIQEEQELFRSRLDSIIDMKHEIVLLAQSVNWHYFEEEFTPLYAKQGAKSKPIRLMVGCLLLKHLYNLGDETLVKRWVENPYMQYFCGEVFFQHKLPFDPSELVHFRHRLGVEGVNKIFVHSIKLHGKDAEEKQVISDTTVQGNFITYPTDAKQYYRIITYCNKIANKAGIKQRQSYMRTGKNLLRSAYNAKHPKRAKKARAAYKHLRVLAGRVLRELDRVLSPEFKEKYKVLLSNCNKMLKQEKDSKDKIYSFYKPHTACIAKGKVEKPYEYGNKIGIIATARTNIIVAALAFLGNPNDGKTIDPLIEQEKKNEIELADEMAYDRAVRGPKVIKSVKILTPSKPKKNDTAYQKRKKRKLFRARAGIEAIFSHLKRDFRMQENYLWDEEGCTINAMLSCTAWNLKILMRKLIFLFCLCKKMLFCNFISLFSPILKQNEREVDPFYTSF